MAETFAARIEALKPHLTIVPPPGGGPAPVVVQLHGCGGRKRLQDYWAQRVQAMGAGAVIVDSYAHRGIGPWEAYATVCLGLRLWGRERAGDLFAALAIARALPFAKPNKIIAGGWSHGGWTILDALALRTGGEAQRATRLSDLPDEPLQGLAGAFLLYPYCGPAALARRGLRFHTPIEAIVGGRDSIVGAHAPTRVLNDLAARGADIRVHRFDEATHAFDERDANDFRVRHDPLLVARAEDLMRAFIARIAP